MIFPRLELLLRVKGEAVNYTRATGINQYSLGKMPCIITLQLATPSLSRQGVLRPFGD